MLLKILREGLGRLIVFIDFVTKPQPIKRSHNEQAEVDKIVKGLSLYQFYACPFCIKTRRAIHRLNIPVELRNAQVRRGQHREALRQGGGEVKVPCLRIEDAGKVSWMYESSTIIAYLNARFDSQHG